MSVTEERRTRLEFGARLSTQMSGVEIGSLVSSIFKTSGMSDQEYKERVTEWAKINPQMVQKVLTELRAKGLRQRADVVMVLSLMLSSVLGVLLADVSETIGEDKVRTMIQNLEDQLSLAKVMDVLERLEKEQATGE